ncbi:MAG: hypothetical protein Q9180_004840 [Flavoplaca navasiana]
MLENGCAFTAAFTIGNNKVDDSAELGVYRNNWHMLRDHCDHVAGAGPSDWKSRGQELQYVHLIPSLNPHYIESPKLIHPNSDDVVLATKCQRQLWSKLGESTYFGLQRGGASNTGAGVEYGKYCHKYLDFIVKGGHLSDNVATYYNVASM